MKEAKLRELYSEAVKLVRAERRWRESVFMQGHPKRALKLAEMDRLIDILVQLKDALKPHVEPDMAQGSLIDVPTKTDY